VGKIECSDVALTGDTPAGEVRLSFSTRNDSFENDPGEVSRILNDVAEKISSGEHKFTVMDLNGNTVGQLHFPQEVHVTNDRIDIAKALSDGRVLMADDGWDGIADGEYRYAVTHPDTPYGYHSDEVKVWLVNAVGETSADYDEPQPVRETLLSPLNKEQREQLLQVISGEMTLEDHERRLNPDDDPQP
jgi:hypothetical protein